MKRSRSLYLLSPAPLVVIIWLFTFAAVAIGYAARDQLPVMLRTMELNGIDFNFPLAGMVWIGISLLAFSIFGFAAIRPFPRAAPTVRPDDLSLALKFAALAHAFIIVIVFAWVMTSAMNVGGIHRLIAMANPEDNYTARYAILENKLFPGMRLLYTGLIALGLFGACAFAVNLQSPDRSRRAMALGLGMFLVSVMTLSVLPIFLSQRILLIHMVLSTFIAVSMISGRLFHIRYALILSGLLFAVWSMREAVTIGPWASEFSSPRIGLEKILYYFINDFHNSVSPFAADFLHTYGIFTFSFLLYFSTFEGVIFDAFADRMALALDLRAGGEFPAFTTPYIDFSWGAIFIIVVLAVIFTWVFNKAHRSFAFALVYGQIGGALLLSPHNVWYAHHNFIFNLLLTGLVCAFIRGRQRGAVPGKRNRSGPQ